MLCPKIALILEAHHATHLRDGLTRAELREGPVSSCRSAGVDQPDPRLWRRPGVAAPSAAVTGRSEPAPTLGMMVPMFRGTRKPQRGLELLAIAVALTLLVSACGGSSSHKSSTSKSSTSKSSTTVAKTTTTTASKPVAPVAATTLSESVLAFPKATYASTAKVKAGDTVAFRTLVPGKPATKAHSVQLKFSGGPSNTLSVTATGGGHTAVTLLTSANGKPLTLSHLRYTCQLPPSPSYCPPKQQSVSAAGWKLKFSTLPTEPVVVVATVGPVKTPAAPVHIASPTLVPPYTPTELLETLTPPPANAPRGASLKASAVTTVMAVKPGQPLLMLTQLTGTVVGDTQPTTVTIPQGPARSITITATVDGVRTAVGTVTSADAKPITLLLPRYSCSVAPSPTFCPVKKIVIGHHRYQLTFMLSPYSPLLQILATVG